MDRPNGPPERRAGWDLYLVKSLLHAAEILWAFQHAGESLRLRDVMDRTSFSKGMCFRLLYTLHHCGFLNKVEGNRYRLTSEVRRRKRYRIGYAAQGQDSSFPREVHAGLTRAAEREQLELILVDNRYQPKVALRNAEHLIREGVDLVIEFQTDEAVAPAIASKYLEAGIPLIATTTNVTTAAGATGATVFNSFSNLQITNNTRPQGSTAPLGQFFGEYSAARDPRIIQLGVKLYF